MQEQRKDMLINNSASKAKYNRCGRSVNDPEAPDSGKHGDTVNLCGRSVRDEPSDSHNNRNTVRDKLLPHHKNRQDAKPVVKDPAAVNKYDDHESKSFNEEKGRFISFVKKLNKHTEHDIEAALGSQFNEAKSPSGPRDTSSLPPYKSYIRTHERAYTSKFGHGKYYIQVPSDSNDKVLEKQKSPKSIEFDEAIL
uniref:Uncharacterized protein n=1 Tax=Romanomermis culicivorax TaxID=13658 RepID=A0A915JM43_ROMCU